MWLARAKQSRRIEMMCEWEYEMYVYLQLIVEECEGFAFVNDGADEER